MSKIVDFFEIDPFSLTNSLKVDLFGNEIINLTKFHAQNCHPYSNILKNLNYDLNNLDYRKVPYLPVSLFKQIDLMSVTGDKIAKEYASSGTSGQRLSKIFIDQDTSSLQFKALSKIFSSFISRERNPMIILDSKKSIQNRQNLSARGAGILGFSSFSKDIIFAFDEEMNLDFSSILDFISKHKSQKIILFGFTYIIWLHFLKELMRTSTYLSITTGLVIHGGGWKKLSEDASVSKIDFHSLFKKFCGIEVIHDYYGMVEQTGSIYFECTKGYFHTSIFSDILIRDKNNLEIIDGNNEGIIQVSSVLPRSYPGHVLLTEDMGVVGGIDDCKCGRLGTYFKVSGRIKNSEIRGCSDTYDFT